MRNSVGLGLGGIISLSSGRATPPPESLFQNGEQGAWYDPSDNSTMFQEAGGKTPVTAVEQAVGLILDKSVLTQTTGYYSGAFDGTGDYLTVSNASGAFTYDTGDFTIEAWVRLAAMPSSNTYPGAAWIYGGGPLNSNPGFDFAIGSTNLIVSLVNFSSPSISVAHNMVINTWYHVAAVRNGNTLTAYINGSSVGTANVTGVTADPCLTGVAISAAEPSGSTQGNLNGFISNLRAVKGTAVYTANFTPPTSPLTAISGTSLLTCQNNRFIDNSSNAFTLTVNGNPGVNLFNPFNSTPARMVNNAYQITSASRPTLRARYNLLERSEEFDNAYWTKTNLNTTGTPAWVNVAVAPDGTTTADKLIANTSAAQHYLLRGITGSVVTGTVTLSIYAKAAEQSWLFLYIATSTPASSAYFNLSNGTVGTQAGSPNATITAVGDGWYRCTISHAATGAAANVEIHSSLNGSSISYTGDGTSGILIWGAQLTQTAVFPSNTYQRIAAATDYATGAAFPQYLSFDGTDDSLLTANVDFATVTSDGQARRNLLLNPTQFDAAAWSVLNAAIVANSTAAPDNTTTADTFNVTDATNTVKRIDQVLSPIPSGANVFSVYIKAGTQNFVQLLGTGDAQAFANFDVSAGTVGTFGSKTTASIQNVGNGWYRCIAAFDSSTVYTGGTFRISMQTLASAVYGGTTPNTGTFFLWGAQLETGSTATAFQNIGTDKMTVFSGVSKLSDAAAGTVVELSATLGSNNGTFLMRAPDSAAPNYYGWYSKGTVFLNSATATSATYAAPATSVLTGVGDISVDTQILRINAVQAATAATDQGTGNFGTYPLYIGRRNNASLPFNGRIYSLIVCGANFNNDVILQTESYVASKTPLGSVP